MSSSFGLILVLCALNIKGSAIKLIESAQKGLVFVLTLTWVWQYDFVRALTFSNIGAAYIYIHDNYCLFHLPWDSPMTWLIAAIGIDFVHYWVHRAVHGKLKNCNIRMFNVEKWIVSEINLLWALHQTHHSSEEFNLATGLRQSAFQSFGFLVLCNFLKAL